MFIKWPKGIKSGKRINRVVSVTDLLPTLSEMCGIPCETNHPLDGVSVKETILENDSEWEDRYILNYWRGKVSIRSQKYRLDPHGGLFNIEADRGQKTDLSQDLSQVKEEMMQVADAYRKQIDKELPKEDMRPFYLGHPALKYTQIPARDAKAHGEIERSNRYPNCSFFTHWVRAEDSITWQVEVPEDGKFRVTLYYTCKEGDQGSTLQLSLGDSKLQYQVSEAWDPPLRGMDEDLAPRIESYVKDWKVVEMGDMELKQGKGTLSLTALDMPGSSVIDFRLFLFERL